jgi:hypothetical protein
LASFAACITAAASGFTASKAATDAKPSVFAAFASMPVGAKPAFCIQSKQRTLDQQCKVNLAHSVMQGCLQPVEADLIANENDTTDGLHISNRS